MPRFSCHSALSDFSKFSRRFRISLPDRPRLRSTPALAAAAFAAFASLAGCSALSSASSTPPETRRVVALLPADAILLGEQHDAPEHHQIEVQVVQVLADRGVLAAVAMEMAEQGRSTAKLPPAASEAEVRSALAWDDKGWPWADYGPAVMAAVRAGVPVLGANLPRSHMRDAMKDVSLDAQLTGAARAAQQQAVREGHCDLLPESQIEPMTRIQIARDRAMAQTVIEARVPGKTVLLISGAGHSDKALGVPQHLPTDLSLRVVRMQAGGKPAESTAPARFDLIWLTPALPEKDYCAELRKPTRAM